MEKLPSDQPLMEAGLDSISAIELRNAINNHFSIDLPATASFDHPTIDALAAFIVAQHAAVIETPGVERRARGMDIADILKVGVRESGCCSGFWLKF